MDMHTWVHSYLPEKSFTRLNYIDKDSRCVDGEKEKDD